MSKPIAFLCCLFCAVVVFFTLRFNYFSIYQLLPIVLFYISQVTVFRDINSWSIRICYALAIICLLIFPLFTQLGWYFDINKMASKSSTSGLLFVFLPIYAILPGILPCVIAWVIKSKNNH